MANDKTPKFSSIIIDAVAQVAIIKDGDSITIDVENRALDLNITQQEIDHRMAGWQVSGSKEKRGVLAKYARQVSSVSEGAVTDRF